MDHAHRFVLLICGGRDYVDRRAVFAALDKVHEKKSVTLVIHGAAKGADMLGAMWGVIKQLEVQSFAADWVTHGPQAGMIRNILMLRDGLPHGVVAFPGGRGTADMIKRSRAAGVPVWEPYPGERGVGGAG